MKNRITAALLAFFFGGLGVHRFYLGQTGRGFLYLLFCWVLIPVLIAFIDFIVFLCMSDESFDAKYNQKQQVPFVSKQTGNVADELERLHSLLEKGIISETEFQVRKNKLLN